MINEKLKEKEKRKQKMKLSDIQCLSKGKGMKGNEE